jgi:phosphoribosylformylglycinamidine cyclo-ligase
VPDDDMRRTFNMGIGLIVVCSAVSADRVLEALAAAGEPHAVRIGRIIAGHPGVEYGGV